MAGAYINRFIVLCTVIALFIVPLSCSAANPNIPITSDARLTHLAKLVSDQLSEPAGSGLKFVVTIGPESLEKELSSGSNSPIVALYTTSHEFRRITTQSKNFNESKRLISALYMDIDPRFNAALANTLAPVGKKMVAITPETELVVTPELEAFYSKSGVRVNYIASGDTKEMLSLADSVDVLVSYRDESLVNDVTIKPIVFSLYRRKKFLIGTSKKITSSGALASIYLNVDKYLSQSVATVNQFIKSGSVTVGGRYSTAVEISVNRTLAKALDYYATDLDEEVLRENVLRSVDTTR